MLKKIVTIVLCLIVIDAVNTGKAFSESKKKLFINNINHTNDPETASKIKDFITLGVFENKGRFYQIITEEDVKVMFEKAELLMATGVDSENSIIQVANVVNADEIIYGKITKEGGKYRLTVHNLERDAKTQSAYKKSFLNEVFAETQMEWYCKEIAKKLVDPSYNIDTRRAVSQVVARFDVEDVQVKAFEGINIQKMKFESSDEIIQRVIKDLTVEVEKGDVMYDKKNYDDALEKYREVIMTIGKKLRKDTQEKITPFIEGVLERIAAVHSQDVKISLEKIDKWLRDKQEKELDMDILSKGKTQYEKIIKYVAEFPKHEREKMGPILQAIEDRLTAIYVTWVSLYEKKGDLFYGEYSFRAANTSYNDAIKLIETSRVHNDKMTESKNRMEKKKQVVVETAMSWLENKVESYCSSAEYLNMKNKTGKAKDCLDKAKQLIQKNEDFANEKMISTYKDTARLILQ